MYMVLRLWQYAMEFCDICDFSSWMILWVNNSSMEANFGLDAGGWAIYDMPFVLEEYLLI